MAFFNISLGAQLAYKIIPIKFYREWPNLNPFKILFCKVAVPLVKFAIKDLKMTKKYQNNATLLILAPYNTREEGQHRKISVNPESRNVRHTKKSNDAFVHWLIFPQFTRLIRVVCEPSPLISLLGLNKFWANSVKFWWSYHLIIVNKISKTIWSWGFDMNHSHFAYFQFAYDLSHFAYSHFAYSCFVYSQLYNVITQGMFIKLCKTAIFYKTGNL